MIRLVMLMFFLMWLPAEAHDWYVGLQDEAGISCCSTRDCRPVPSRDNLETGNVEIEIQGAWHPVTHIHAFPSPDGQYHACFTAGGISPFIRCIFAPAGA